MSALEQISPNLSPRDLEEEVIRWSEAVYQEADEELAESPATKLTGKLIDYIAGRQWSSKARYGRSRPVLNRIFRHFIEQVSVLTDLELDFTLKFTDKGLDGFSELERLMNAMIVDWAFSPDADFEMELSQAVMYGLINSGPCKVQWNPALCDGLGDVEFLPLSPLNFLTVGGTGKVKDAEVCIYRHVVTMQELLRRHGDVAKGVKPDPQFSEMPGQVLKPARFTKSSWGSMSPTLRKILGQQTQGVRSQYPRTMRKEFWIKDDTVWSGKESIVVGEKKINGRTITPSWAYRVEPGMRLFPRGRVLVTAGGKVLEDSPNPYWHGRMPFPIYRAFRVPWLASAGLSPLEPIAAMQAILNRINGGMLDTVYAAIEPTLMGPKAAFSQQDWDTLDTGQFGGKIAYQNKTPRVPEWRTPPELKAYVGQYKNDIEREMDMSSGASAIQQALQKKQVPGGDVLDTVMNSRSVNIRLMGRNLKSFLTETGNLVCSNMLQFYDARRRIAKYGADGIVGNDFTPVFGNLLPSGMEPEQFVRKVNFSIRKGSLLGIEKQERTPVVFALRKNKDLSRRRLFAFLDVNMDQALNEKELKEEMAEQAAIAAAAGAMGKGHKK